MNAATMLLVAAAAFAFHRGVRQVRRDGLMRRTGASRGRSRTPTIVSVSSERLLEVVRRFPRWTPWVAGAGSLGVVIEGPLVGVASGLGAWIGLRYRERVRARHLTVQRDEQLADAVGAVASSLRAGMSASQAIAFAEAESAEPLRASLASMSRSVSLGESFDRALDRWSRQLDTDDARLVAGVLQLHRRSGGDLPAVLDQVAGTLRERQAAGREVRALTAQARLSGLILGILPVGFFAFLWLTSRSQIDGAFRSPAGIMALTLGAALEGVAFLWIRSLLEVR